MKAGYKTTEFWLTILNTILMVLVGVGVLSQDEQAEWQAVITPVVGTLLPLVLYIWSRTQVKARFV